MRRGMINSRWFFVWVMFLFLLFSQLMGFFIEPITTLVSENTTLSDRWLNLGLHTDMIFMLAFLMVWGILFDRHSRKRLLTIAGFLWGVTAWLMGIAPTFVTFDISKAANGVSRASYPGILAMVGDLFKPSNRGKVFSLLLLTQPLAIVLGTLLMNLLDLEQDWRLVLLTFGAIGFLLTLAIQFGVKEPTRGAKEPALVNIRMRGDYIIDAGVAKFLITTPSLLLTYAIIFFGTIPVVVLLGGLPIFFSGIHAMQPYEISLFLLPPMVGVILGYPVGGFFGDFLSTRIKLGRLLPCLIGFVLPPVFLFSALSVDDVRGLPFLLNLLLVSFFMALTLPNLFATIMDVILPELRASACALGWLFQILGILTAQNLLSVEQNFFTIDRVLFWLCVGGWLVCIILLLGLFNHIPKDVETLRRQMAYRSFLETRLAKLDS